MRGRFGWQDATPLAVSSANRGAAEDGKAQDLANAREIRLAGLDPARGEQREPRRG